MPLEIILSNFIISPSLVIIFSNRLKYSEFMSIKVLVRSVVSVSWKVDSSVQKPVREEKCGLIWFAPVKRAFHECTTLLSIVLNMKMNTGKHKESNSLFGYQCDYNWPLFMPTVHPPAGLFHIQASLRRYLIR